MNPPSEINLNGAAVGEGVPRRRARAKLVLERIGIYPQSEGDGFAIFDHTFEGNSMVQARRASTDQIIAVYVDANGKAGHLSHES